MQDDEANPSLALGLYRVSVLVGCIFLITCLFWDMFSATAAVNRLSAAANNFHYTERCDSNGNLIDTGEPNCVDLGNYLLINGPVLKALRRACAYGSTPAMLILEKGKASRIEIARVEKSLAWRVANKVSAPC
ncbi:hypothetical protein [Rhizobium sp. CIAT894]|uniref:hypothetical protein n=1 Tax=Rhizobium sp. CIAT894 TaxID=2020312 RepID=UPI000A1EE229|nr:hypothetical protein [Rhizobium sp. CIAT894]